MNCPSCSKKVDGSYEPGSYSCSGCGGQIQVNPAKKNPAYGLTPSQRRKLWPKKKTADSDFFEVQYARTKSGPISVAQYKSLEDAKKFLADIKKDGWNGIISKGGKSVKDNPKKNPQPKKARPVDEVLEEQYPSKGEKLKLHWDEEGGYDGEYGSYVDEEGYAWQQRLFQEGGVHCFICGAPLSEGWESDVMDYPRESCPRHVEIADIGKTTGRPKKGTPGWNEPDRTAWVEDVLSNPGSAWHINQAQSEAVQTRMSEMQGGLAYFPKSDAAQHRDKWENQLRMASGGMGGSGAFNDKVYKKAHDASAAAYIDYGKKMDADSYYGGYHPSYLPSQEPTRWIGNPSSNPPSQELFDSIVFGSKVTIENRHGEKQTGRAIIYNAPGMLADGSHGSWTLNMGGRYGRPGRATPSNVVSVPKKRGGKRTLGMMRLTGDYRNPPFAEHKLEAKEKHWALEDNPAGSEIFGVDDMEEWASTIKSGLNAPYSRVRITTDTHIRERISMIVRLSLDEREDWENGIFENSRWAQIGLGNDGTMEMPYHGLGRYKGMRKTKFKSADDVVRKINAWIQKSTALDEATAAYTKLHPLRRYPLRREGPSSSLQSQE